MAFPLPENEARGLLVAPLAGAAVVVVAAAAADPDAATVQTVLSSGLLAVIVAFATMVLAGLPLWLAFRRAVRPNAMLAVLTGAVAAVLPLLILSGIGTTKTYVFDGRVLIADYHYTEQGWHDHLRDLATAAAAGAAAGVCFWAVAQRPRRRGST